MTQEQAIKHSEVIKWWLDNSDKGVWHKSLKQEWFIDYDPYFYTNPHTYVQNDEYSKLRKALADGKTIQAKPYSIDGSSTYTDLIFTKEEPIEALCIGDLRIKPDVPVFNVDDWGTVQHEDGVFLFRIIKVRDNRLYYGKSITAYVFANNAKLWKPAEGEWVVVWQGNWVENYQVKRYYTAITYDNIAPLKFIQTLKDK